MRHLLSCHRTLLMRRERAHVCKQKLMYTKSLECPLPLARCTVILLRRVSQQEVSLDTGCVLSNNLFAMASGTLRRTSVPGMSRPLIMCRCFVRNDSEWICDTVLLPNGHVLNQFPKADAEKETRNYNPTSLSLWNWNT